MSRTVELYALMFERRVDFDTEEGMVKVEICNYPHYYTIIDSCIITQTCEQQSTTQGITAITAGHFLQGATCSGGVIVSYKDSSIIALQHFPLKGPSRVPHI
jgi:hypothetical protein